MADRLIQILTSIGYLKSELHLSRSLHDFQKQLQHITPELALIDLHLPDGNGLNVVEILLQKKSEMPIIVISAWCDEITILNAIKKGAIGYLLKEREDLEIVLAIRSVLRGGSPIDPFIAQYLIQQSSHDQFNQPKNTSTVATNSFNLTEKETEVLQLIARGMSNQEIADHLFVSKNTVETHIRHCYQKLLVSNRIMATQKAKANGII